jgi:hypothetical protein
MAREPQAVRFCNCIKKVRKTIKLRKNLAQNKESAAIAVCVKSVLQRRGRTLKKFRCGPKARVETQPIRSSAAPSS